MKCYMAASGGHNVPLRVQHTELPSCETYQHDFLTTYLSHGFAGIQSCDKDSATLLFEFVKED